MPCPMERASSLFTLGCLKLKISWQIALNRLISTCWERDDYPNWVCVFWVHGVASPCAAREWVVERLSHASKSVPAIIKKANNHSRNLMAFSGEPRGALAQNREHCWQLQKIIHSLLAAHLYRTRNGCNVEREEVNRYCVHTQKKCLCFI